MTNTKSPTAISLPSGLSPMEMPAPLNKPFGQPLPSWSRTLYRTRYLLATPAGWIADQSKTLPKQASRYTVRHEQALSFATHEAATQRAKALKELEPEIMVMPIELHCDPAFYPLRWQKADD